MLQLVYYRIPLDTKPKAVVDQQVSFTVVSKKIGKYSFLWLPCVYRVLRAYGALLKDSLRPPCMILFVKYNLNFKNVPFLN